MTYGNGFGDEALRLFRETREIDWKPAENSKISTFFAGKHILVTGATGFLGKLVVEKLLRACPDLAKIYIIVREKKGQAVEERLKTIYNDPLYGPLTKLQPHFREKIHVIPGDISAPNLNLSAENESLLTSKLNVIFHIAATVRFDEPLPSAIKTNVRATRDIINLAHRSPNLISFVHISTAYANSTQQDIHEKFYPFPIPYDDLIKMAENDDDEELSPKVTHGWPNTYTFTKAAAEACVKSLGAGLPICVFRPAVVIATYKEPLRSWIDNLYGPTGIVVGAGTGVLKTIYCKKDFRAELVPGDYVTNAMIAAAHRTAVDANRGDDIKVYNYVSGPENPITWQDFTVESFKWGDEVPSMHCITYYSLNLTPYYWLHTIFTIFLQFIPAYLMDFGMLLTGKKPMLVKIYSKIWKLESVLEYFCTRQWTFGNDNTRALWSKLEGGDKRAFPFSMADFKWEEYHKTHILGLRVYLLKDDLSSSSTKEARQKWKRLYYVHVVLKTLFYLGVLRVAYLIYSCFVN